MKNRLNSDIEAIRARNRIKQEEIDNKVVDSKEADKVIKLLKEGHTVEVNMRNCYRGFGNYGIKVTFFAPDEDGLCTVEVNGCSDNRIGFEEIHADIIREDGIII